METGQSLLAVSSAFGRGDRRRCNGGQRCDEGALSRATMSLVWADEFNKPGPPDPTNWTFERGFVRNEELQWYQPENASCRDGMLVIEARRERLANPSYDPNSSSWRRSGNTPSTRRLASSRRDCTTGPMAGSRCEGGSTRGRGCGRRSGRSARPAPGPAAARSTSWSTIAGCCWPTPAGPAKEEARRSGTISRSQSPSSPIRIGRPSSTSGGWTGTRTRSSSTLTTSF